MPFVATNIGRQWWFEGLGTVAGRTEYNRYVKDAVKGILALQQRGFVFTRLLLTTKIRQKSAVYINIFLELSVKIEEVVLRNALKLALFQCTLVGPTNIDEIVYECMVDAIVVVDETTKPKM